MISLGCFKIRQNGRVMVGKGYGNIHFMISLGCFKIRQNGRVMVGKGYGNIHFMISLGFRIFQSITIVLVTETQRIIFRCGDYRLPCYCRRRVETREKALLRNSVSEDEILAGVLKSKTLRQERIATMNQLRVLRLLDLQYEREEGGRKPRAESGGGSTRS
ncbi:hypothetical protein IV203_037672 [Nitzschia inconspicua]|uniref:Uncharacterized protein n=1 Tax=Nitzschia inconspicua TaxID=303405 RepID=A0A9K3LMA5_9STRA|nr:hypothetical protein IV203_037672 [Nitzschia inconspicua]